MRHCIRAECVTGRLRQLVELHDQPMELDLDDVDLDEPCFGEPSVTRSTICEFGSTKGLAADWQQAHSSPILIKDFLNPNIYKVLSPSSHTPPPSARLQPRVRRRRSTGTWCTTQ